MATEGTYQYGDQFQRHALAVLARIPGGVVRYRSALDPAYFGTATLRQIAETLFEHVDTHRALPQRPTLLEELRDRLEGEDYKRAEKSVDQAYREDVSDSKAVLERLIDFGQQQAYVNATLRAAEEIQRGKRDVRKLFDEASIVGEDLLDIGIDYRLDVEARRAYYLNPDDQAEMVRTGIPHLDLLLGGGLGRGELGVILAPPKRGKTLALVNIGFGALTSTSRYNVAHYSLEIHEKKVARRYDDRLMGARIEMRGPDPERYGRVLTERVKRFVRGKLFVKSYPTRTASVGKIRSHLSMLAARGFHPDVLLADYADIMKPERRLGEMRHEQAGIYEDLRQLAGEFNCAVWTGSQTTRGALEKDTVTIEDFAEAFEKAAIVDAAIAFCLQRDQSVLTDQGPVKILDLKKRLAAGPIAALSHNFETGLDEWKPIVNWFHNGLAKANGFLRVKTEITGHSKGSVTTPEHEYFTPAGLKVRAKDVRRGSLVVGRGYILTPAQRQVVLGTLLGDGHLRPDGTLAVQHGKSQSYYVRWKRQVFAGLGTSLTPATHPESEYRGVVLKARTAEMLTVRGAVEIRRMRKLFYPRGVKVVPEAVLDELDVLGLGVWFMDDGCFAKDGERAVLHVNGFAAPSRVRMRSWFLDRWGLTGMELDSGAFQFDADSSRRLKGLLRDLVVPSNKPRETKRFLCPTVPSGEIRSQPVRVLSVETADYVNRERLDIEVQDNHNFYLASGVLVSNCETRDERIEGKCRLFGAALRNSEDGRTVECEVNRAQARLRSTALFDVAGSRILMEGEKADATLDSTSFIVRARKRDEAQKLKDKTREKKKGRKVRVSKMV